MSLFFDEATADLDGIYRYDLQRRWRVDGPLLTFVMLNPSTADASSDDPTIRRCIGFAKRDGFAGIRVVNLFAFRATDPDVLLHLEDDVRTGPRNVAAIEAAIDAAVADRAPVVAAWGSWWRDHAKPGRMTRPNVEAMARAKVWNLSCLGVTKDGEPRHPLFVRRDAPLVAL